MKILSCCPLAYYSQVSGESYEYLSFVDTLRKMGHRTHHFEHVQAASAGREPMWDFFLSILRNGAYDLVLVMTHLDEFSTDVLDQARQYSRIVAWNCDDDWRWHSYSSAYAPHYTHMVTTYRHIYEANKSEHPNLLLSQWGCTGLCEGMGTEKDIDISFVGACYGKRQEYLDRLAREFDLQAYGKNVRLPVQSTRAKLKRMAARLLRISLPKQDRQLADQTAVKSVWNRSRISFTPLETSQDQQLQIKARVFDMGLSGSVMLCNKNPAIHEFYEPGKEFVEFESLGECIDEVRYLLAHESERQAIARRYYDRTRAEHLWPSRFDALFRSMGL